MKKVYVSISNDIVTDNRVDKTCKSLIQNNFEVVLIGRKKHNSPVLKEREYKCKRMKLLFEKSFFFYAELNIRLFFTLLFSKQDILWSNDLDTLAPNFLVSKIKNKPLIFDSHEHFTKVPELKHNKFAKWFWEKLEQFILPRIKNVITVCQPIADYFKEQYNVNAIVVRNIPLSNRIKIPQKTKEELKIKNDKPLIVWQGSVNIERGLEELIKAMPLINAYLYVIGNGDIRKDLEKLSCELNLDNKVFFISALPFEQMMQYTINADLGISIDKDTNLNYAISLPNKLFEYINANIPMLISPLLEIKPIVQTFNIGEFLLDYNSQSIAQQINNLLSDKERLSLYKENCNKASEKLCWENEEEKIINLINNILQ